jgi:RNA polymerase sigma-70 factor (ECF subfamily)
MRHETEVATLKTDEPTSVRADFGAAMMPELLPAFRLAGFILADYSDAEDAVQDALLLAWRNWASLRDPARLHAWFVRIVVNVCRARLRGRSSRDVVLDDTVADTSMDPFEAALARDAIGRGLQRLNAEQRIVVVLHYWGRWTLPEIAQRLGVPLGTVKSRHHYSLIALRDEMTRKQDEASP